MPGDDGDPRTGNHHVAFLNACLAIDDERIKEVASEDLTRLLPSRPSENVAELLDIDRIERLFEASSPVVAGNAAQLVSTLLDVAPDIVADQFDPAVLNNGLATGDPYAFGAAATVATRFIHLADTIDEIDLFRLNNGLHTVDSTVLAVTVDAIAALVATGHHDTAVSSIDIDLLDTPLQTDHPDVLASTTFILGELVEEGFTDEVLDSIDLAHLDSLLTADAPDVVGNTALLLADLARAGHGDHVVEAITTSHLDRALALSATYPLASVTAAIGELTATTRSDLTDRIDPDRLLDVATRDDAAQAGGAHAVAQYLSTDPDGLDRDRSLDALAAYQDTLDPAAVTYDRTVVEFGQMSRVRQQFYLWPGGDSPDEYATDTSTDAHADPPGYGDRTLRDTADDAPFSPLSPRTLGEAYWRVGLRTPDDLRPYSDTVAALCRFDDPYTQQYAVEALTAIGSTPSLDEDRRF